MLAAQSMEFAGGKSFPSLAVADSISLGRFTTETLDWGRWSTFTHNRYLEEAEKSSVPGSVAEKKAYFEAYYNKKKSFVSSDSCGDGMTEGDGFENSDSFSGINDSVNNVGSFDECKGYKDEISLVHINSVDKAQQSPHDGTNLKALRLSNAAVGEKGYQSDGGRRSEDAKSISSARKSSESDLVFTPASPGSPRTSGARRSNSAYANQNAAVEIQKTDGRSEKLPLQESVNVNKGTNSTDQPARKSPGSSPLKLSNSLGSPPSSRRPSTSLVNSQVSASSLSRKENSAPSTSSPLVITPETKRRQNFLSPLSSPLSSPARHAYNPACSAPARNSSSTDMSGKTKGLADLFKSSPSSPANPPCMIQVMMNGERNGSSSKPASAPEKKRRSKYSCFKGLTSGCISSFVSREEKAERRREKLEEKKKLEEARNTHRPSENQVVTHSRS